MKVTIWFDDKGEYEDEVSELQFGDVKLHILDGTNWLYSKYLLNEEDKESKYLVYAAFAKPSDAENPLADMYYYSTPYYTDRVSQMSQEIGIDNRFKEHLSHYGNFWKNKHRIEKFKELGIDHYNAQTIDIGLIAVLTDVKTPNFEEVVKQMMLGDNEKSVSLMEFSSDIKTLVANYQKESYLIDSYYRWFYYAYDQIEDNSKFSDVRQRVENIYANTYLQKITPKWNENFTNDVMNATDLPKQEDFYKHYLRGYDGKQRVIVIISDAFRYECAKELFSRLELDEKCTPKMECMLSCLPSVTSVGMASLLPHKEMQVDGNLNVNVDGQACASMEQKDKILKSYNENNVALSFDEVANANQARIRELIQGKNIVYIYHNQVDARGDKPASENEVFNACAEAIEEIHKLVKKLTGYVSAPKFFITADHGFLYNSDDQEIIDEGVDNVKRILRDNYVRPDEAQKILSLLRERGSYTVIDRITVVLNTKEDRYEATFSNLGIKNIPISADYVKDYDRLLCGGIWCILQLDYEFIEEDKKNTQPIRIRKLTPIQMPHVDMDEVKNGRKAFTKEESAE